MKPHSGGSPLAAVRDSAGAVAGLALAAGTIGAAMLRTRSPGTVADLLGVVFAVWALGWMLGPAYNGQPVLRAAQFQLLPIPRRVA